MTQDLLSARVLKRSLAWNALRTLLPLAAAVLAVPLLIKGLGTDRFGLLTIVWALVGYASLFDLGLGRALTLIAAERLGRGDDKDLSPLLWTALWWLLGLGLLAALVLRATAPWLVQVTLAWHRSLQATAGHRAATKNLLHAGLVKSAG